MYVSRRGDNRQLEVVELTGEQLRTLRSLGYIVQEARELQGERGPRVAVLVRGRVIRILLLVQEYSANLQLASEDTTMRLSRTHFVPVLAIVAGGALGASLSFGLLALVPSGDVPVAESVVAPSATDESVRRLMLYLLEQREALEEATRATLVREGGSMVCQYGDVYSLDWNEGDPWVDLSPEELRIWYEGNRSLICFDGVGVDTSIWDKNVFPASDVENTALLKADAAVPLYGAQASAGVIRVTLWEDRPGR